MTFIVDCYNAAPDSVKAALSTLGQTPCPQGAKRVAVLSDMLELGKHARILHKMTGEYVGASAADALYCFGSDAKYYIDGALKKGMSEDSCHFYEDKQEMIAALKKELKEGDVVLFKGSRGMKLEEAVDALE